VHEGHELGHCCKSAQRWCAHLWVNVAHRRAGKRAAPLLRPAAMTAIAFTLSLIGCRNRQGCKKCVGVFHGSGRATVLFLRRTRAAVDLRWTTDSVFGPDLAQVGESIHGPDLRPVLRVPGGLGRTGFGLWAGYGLRIFLKNFSFSETVLRLLI
jgi:hypothetical protein